MEVMGDETAKGRDGEGRSIWMWRFATITSLKICTIGWMTAMKVTVQLTLMIQQAPNWIIKQPKEIREKKA
jgi:hypothetical protein